MAQHHKLKNKNHGVRGETRSFYLFFAFFSVKLRALSGKNCKVSAYGDSHPRAYGVIYTHVLPFQYLITALQ